MKNLFLFSILSFILSNTALCKDEKKTARNPNQADQITNQVQLCAGTQALGSEGEGIGASAIINIYADISSSLKPAPLKCDMAFAFAYEYGNDRGLKIGNISPYNMMIVPTGKTECTVKEEQGQLTLTVTKAANLRSKRAPKVLVDNCKISTNGFN